jgi:cysteine desulfurase
MNPILVEKFRDYLLEYPYNAGTVYEWGLKSKRILEETREEIKKKLKWKGELVFTSGGTEGNNLAIKALTENRSHGVVWYSQTAHASLTAPVDHLMERGWEAHPLPLRKGGIVDIDQLVDLPKPDLVAIEWVNSEVGFIQPIESLGSWLKKEVPLAKLVVDSVQGIGKLPCPDWTHVDAFVISGHKFGAPVGVGALALKEPKNMHPLQFGGGQEYGWRSGTVATANILCLRDALFEAYDNLKQDFGFSDFDGEAYFMRELGVDYSPFIGLLKTDPVDGEILLHQLEAKGIAVGLGSACQAYKKKPSKTLQLLGFKGSAARKTLRLSWTPQTHLQELENALELYRDLHLESCKYFK